MDRVVYLNCKILRSDKWLSFWILPKLKGFETRRPSIPDLFVIVMEVFSCLMRRAISGGFLSGWRVKGRGGEGILISHLFFTDDTLVFCEESQDQLTYLS